jgi:hypothetical protein
MQTVSRKKQDLTNDQVKTLQALKAARRQIMGYLKPEFLVETMRSTVNAAPTIKFMSANAEKFINAKKPILKLTLDKEVALAAYGEIPTSSGKDDEEGNEAVASYVSHIVSQEFIKPFSEILLDAVIENSEAKEKMQSIASDDLPEETMKRFIMTSMFGLGVDVVHLDCLVEFMI